MRLLSHLLGFFALAATAQGDLQKTNDEAERKLAGRSSRGRGRIWSGGTRSKKRAKKFARHGRRMRAGR